MSAISPSNAPHPDAPGRPAATRPPLLRRVAAAAGPDGCISHIDPASAGWDYTTVTVYRLQPGMRVDRAADDQERLVLILEGHAHVRAGDRDLGSLGSRSSVFEGPPPPVLLVGPGDAVEVVAETDALVVVAAAPGGPVRLTRLFRPGDILVEARGSGNTSRTIHHLLDPDAEAGRLIAFEVFTPGGNWSSYPPHKHDTENPPVEARLEEYYFYRFAKPQGFAFQRVYTPDRSLDEAMTPMDGDVVLVPEGYHPVGAPAGYDCYYLNIMAGPNRAWHFTIDPDHAWLMQLESGGATGPGGSPPMTLAVAADSPLARMVDTTPTDYWNDSCAVAELAYAVERGATGATSNPTIVGEVMKKEKDHWVPRVREIADEHRTWSEVEITWALIEEMGVRGAGILAPVFEREDRRKGRLSLQTNPANYRDPARMVEQAIHFATLAPNIQVKFPTTAAGLAAIEEATARGVVINATVVFTVAQCIAAAEAVERGLRRFEAAGGDASRMSPVCSLMVGRLDDWMKVLVDRDDVALDPVASSWAGIAAFKRAYGIYQERGFRTRLLAAAYRHRLHWTELVGADVVLTMPHAWQVRFNNSGIAPVSRIDVPVDQRLVDDLLARIPDFRRAYEPDGMVAEEFEGFGATARTLRSFVGSYHDLVGVVRDIMLPNPDLKPG